MIIIFTNIDTETTVFHKLEYLFSKCLLEDFISDIKLFKKYDIKYIEVFEDNYESTYQIIYKNENLFYEVNKNDYYDTSFHIVEIKKQELVSIYKNLSLRIKRKEYKDIR